MCMHKYKTIPLMFVLRVSETNLYNSHNIRINIAETLPLLSESTHKVSAVIGPGSWHVTVNM